MLQTPQGNNPSSYAILLERGHDDDDAVFFLQQKKKKKVFQFFIGSFYLACLKGEKRQCH